MVNEVNVMFDYEEYDDDLFDDYNKFDEDDDEDGDDWCE